MTLNGWQRLWVVFSAVSLVSAISISYARWPSTPGPFVEPQTRHYTTSDVTTGQTLTVDCALPCRSLTLGDFQQLFRERGFVPADVIYEQIDVAGIGTTAFPFVLFKPYLRVIEEASITANAVRLYRQHVEDLRRQQLTITGFALATWLVCALVAYVAGVAVWWVRRGFIGQ